MKKSLLRKPSLSDTIMFLGFSAIPATIFSAIGFNVFWSIFLGLTTTTIYAYMNKRSERIEKEKQRPLGITGGPMSKEEESFWDEWFEVTDSEEQAQARQYARENDLDESVVLRKLEKTGSYK